MSTSWQTVFLSEKAQGYQVPTLEREFRKHIPDAEIWFPAITADGSIDETSPFASYVFVTPPVPKGLRRLWCVESVLDGLTPEADIAKSLGRTSPLRKGAVVRIIGGPLKGLTATLKQFSETTCTLVVKLDSGNREVTVVRSDLERV